MIPDALTHLPWDMREFVVNFLGRGEVTRSH